MTNTEIKRISLKVFVEFESINDLKMEFDKSSEVYEELEDNLIRDYIIKDDKVRIDIINKYKTMLKNTKQYDYIFHLIWICIVSRDVFGLWIIMRCMYLEHICKNDIEIFIDVCWDKNNVHEFLRKYIIIGEYGFSPMRCVLNEQFD